MDFADHFSSLASQYAEFRPGYPDALFAWLADIVPARKLAWDCACGSGQASRGLANYFERVIATDASKGQIAEAPPHAKIEYRVASAENSHLDNHAADLITVAQAAHWLKLDAFYEEARRVAAPQGILALWTYEFYSTDDRHILACLTNFYENTVSPYWPPERNYVRTGYRTVPFPFANIIEPPIFRMDVSWKFAQILGYLRTWSATKRFRDEKGIDPVEGLETELLPLWGDPDNARIFTFPIYMRVARL